MKKFLLLTLIMCLFGGLSSSLMAQETVHIGNGGTNKLQKAPFDLYAINSVCQQIYTVDEFTTYAPNNTIPNGVISKLTFYENTGQNLTCTDIKVYMKHTDKDAFGGQTDWVTDFTDSDLVFDSNGNTISIVNGVLELPLTNPFTWNRTQSILVYVDVNSKSSASEKSYFNAFSTTSKKTLYYSGSSTSGLDVSNWRAGSSPTTSKAQMGFTFSSGGAAETLTPDKPTLNLPYNNTNDIINPLLRFTLGKNTTHYQIFLGESEENLTAITDVIAKTTDEVDFQTNGLNSGTQYFWKVVATNDKNDDPKTAESDIYNFTTRNITSAPSAITTVSPTNGATDLVNPLLSWEFGLNTEEYQVLLDGNIKIDWTLCTTTTGSYQTSGLSAGEHTWRVNARNSAGTTEGAVYTFSVVSLPDNVTPISPADGATDVTSAIVRFRFAPNTKEYRLLYSDTNTDEMGYISVNNGGTGSTWTSTGGATEMEFTMPYYGSGKTFYWAVDVKNDLGQRSVWNGGEEIAIYSFTTSSISAATNLRSELNNREVTLSWFYGNSNTADEYQVLLGTEQNNLAVVQDWTSRGGLSEGSFSKNGLDAGTTYYWQVNVRKDGGNALSSEIASFTTDPLPSAPTLNYPSNNEEITSDPKLSWTFGENTIEYQLLFGTDSDNLDVVQDWTSTLDTSYQTNGLAIDDYFWKVVARNNIGETSSELFKFTKLGAPDNVTPISHTNGENITSKTIRFKFAEGTEEYRILYGEKADQLAYFGYGNEKDWLETNNVTEFEFEAPYFSPGQTYYWAVDVKNSNGYRSIWNDGDIVDIFSFTAGVLPIENLYPENGTVCNSNPNLEWNYKDGSVQYQVLLGTSENSLNTVSDWSSQLLTIYQTSFNNKETYYWQVNVKDKNGNITEGEIWSFTTLFAPQNVQANPEQIFPTANGGSTTISWDIVEKASSYNVYLNGALYTSTESNEIEITGLGYSMTGHNITVEAVYSDASVVMSNTIVVKVTGKGSIEATIKGSDNNPIEGAIVTLTCTKDEFGNADNVTQHIFETDADGNISGNISNGSYSVNITKPLYSDYNSTEDIIIGNASTTRLNITLEQRLPDNVTPISPENEEENITSTTIRWQFDNNTSEYRFLFGESEENLQYWNGKDYNNTDWISTNSSEGEIELPEFTMSEHTYYWAVEVKNKVGERLYYDGNNVSGNVNAYSFETNSVLPAVYTSPSNGAIGLSDPTLTWNYVGDARQYRVYLGTDQNSLTAQIEWTNREEEATGFVRTGTYQTENLNNATTYYWRVDVKDANDNVYQGKTWSFATLLPAPVATANPAEVVPSSSMTYGSTTISWDEIEGAIGYNVYLGDEKLNAELISDDSYTIEANTLKLAYNMNPGHEIYVEAVYSLGTSMSDAIYVKVTGTGFVNATIYSNDYNHRLEGATVTLTCTKDEFGNVYDGNGTQYVFTTNKDGQIEDGNGGTETRIFNGTYSVIVEKEHYDTYTGTVTIEQDKTTNVNGSNGVILVTTPPSDVTPLSPIDDAEDVSSKTIRWRFAEGTTEYRFLYGQSEDALAYLNNNTAWIPTNGVSEMEAELTSLSINTEYFWAVDVKNALGGQRTVYEATGQKVAIYSFTANATLAVVNVAPTNGSIKQDDPVLTWNYVGDARQYRVFLGTEQNSLTAQIEWTDREEEATGFVRTGTYQTENLTGTTTYYWRVDVKDAKGTVHTGETWSFATPLTVPTNLVAENDSIYPTVATNYVTGNTTISWTGPAGATAYNVYIDENAPSTTTDTSYVVSLERDLNGHSIQVSAIYEGLGESEKSDACIIKVIGYSNVNGTIKDEEGTLLEGATVTFTGKDAFKAEQSLSFATDASGKYNGYVPEGNYIMTVSSDDYLDYTEEDITIVYDATRTKDVTLYSRHIFDVTIDQKTINFNNIDIYLGNKNWDNNADYSGTYFVYYQKDNGEVIKDTKGSYFNKYSTLNSTLLLGKNENFRKTWEGLPNGLYKIGVASDADKKIYWSETIVERRYFVLTNDGNWEDRTRWSNGEMPLSTDNVFVNAKATINSDITVQNVVIVKNEENVYNNSLTIENGGKLTATDVINESAITSFIIKDGGQLHRTGNNLKELNGKFVMNITNPTEWTDKNKTGWQLISVPFSADANISEFTGVNDRYDFYKFDGNNQYEEWINFKDTTNVDLETSFKQGRGYLVSYKAYNTFSPTGVFNPSSSHDFDITTGDKRMSGFQLLGNPFSFNMEWSKVEHSDLVDGFAVVNESGTYNYYDGSNGTIPVGDGFFVKAIGENPTMHYDANSRSRSEQIESINVIASSNKGNDNVIISFAGADKEGFPKLDNFNDKVANIFVNNNDIRYGIFNYDRNTTEVELSFLASVMGRYTISMKANGEFDNLVLVDRFTGIETNMLLEDYSFTASGQQDHNRFVVRLSMNNNDVQEERFVYQSGNELIINGEGFVQIIDIMGRIVYTNDIQGESRIDANNFYSATYVVRVVNENEVKTQKIVIY